jgi:hypothetical protein
MIDQGTLLVPPGQTLPFTQMPGDPIKEAFRSNRAGKNLVFLHLTFLLTRGKDDVIHAWA